MKISEFQVFINWCMRIEGVALGSWALLRFAIKPLVSSQGLFLYMVPLLVFPCTLFFEIIWSPCYQGGPTGIVCNTVKKGAY